MKKSLQRTIKAIVSICFLAFLFYFVNTRDLLSVLKQVDPFYFTLSLLLIVVMVSSSAWKWQVSIKLTGEHVPFRRLCGIYLIGYYFSNILPSNVGGDVVRSFYLGRIIKSQAGSAASVFIERFTGVLLLLLLVVLAPLFRPELYKSPYIVVPALGSLLLFFVLVGLVSIRQPVEKMSAVFEWFVKRLPISPTGWIVRVGQRVLGALGKVYGKVAQAASVAKKDRGALLSIVVLTVWFYFLTWVNVYLAFRTFGAHLSFGDIMSVTPVIMVVSMIPISLGSLGLAEGAYVFYFSMIGSNAPLALAVGLFMRFKVLLVGVVGLGSYLAHRNEVNRDMVLQAAEK